MNQSTVLGMVCALVVFGVAAFTATQSPQVFLDPHGILIVMGGTTAAALICFPMRTLGNLFQVFARKVLGKYSGRNELVIEECCDLSRGYREDDGYLANKSKELKTPFLRDLVELIVQGGVSNEQLHDIMHKRTETHSERYEEEAEIFKTLSKFPPAFGLMATTLGDRTGRNPLRNSPRQFRLHPNRGEPDQAQSRRPTHAKNGARRCPAGQRKDPPAGRSRIPDGVHATRGARAL